MRKEKLIRKGLTPHTDPAYALGLSLLPLSLSLPSSWAGERKALSVFDVVAALVAHVRLQKPNRHPCPPLPRRRRTRGGRDATNASLASTPPWYRISRIGG